MQTADPTFSHLQGQLTPRQRQLQCQPSVPAVTLGPSRFRYSSMSIRPKDCPIWVKNTSVYCKDPFPVGFVIFISFE
ncbi:hypothetical protein CROQUDRAFT_656754 [Cronartium quercuum f. sp. fusiforme G11]|uniref:Uncharacterized protein n=1 Tax=Cronartium quercuum f. sp. fusiforme G11 TaxID=708437 RepID=A0A9P6NNX2_9BASI|nr:hypothetical protein CROQUDRAFT_656754 [Cronartium quercuum f. sp. fusiforme G11]